MFYSCKSQFREKNPFLPFEKFPFLVLARNTESIFRSIICQLVGYSRLKAKENFKLLAIKVVAVAAYER